jgi:hypothetical protein
MLLVAHQNNKKNSMQNKHKSYSRHSPTIQFLGINFFLFFSVMAHSASITSEMSADVATEYKKQLNVQPWPQMHKKLGLMDNPYKPFYKKIKKVIKQEAPEGKRRRVMTHEESLVMAKKKRFDYCQASVPFFVDFAARAHTLSKLENNPLTEEQLMQGNGVKFPFTKEETNDPNLRPAQIALALGWKYQGKGETYAELFLATCLAIPVVLYYKEDKI